jgi:type II secretory pathway pseudopilin PulG
MIKAKKGLLLSVFSLILALVITTSSTYAWFAMNTTVSVNNMQITARADSSFLIIDDQLGDAQSTFPNKMRNINNATLAIAAQDAQNPQVNNFAVLPCIYRDLDGDGSGTAWGWQTNIGTAYDNGAPSTTYSTLQSTNGYVGHFMFYIGLNPYVSKVDATNLKVSGLSYANPGNSVFFPALSVLVQATVGGNTVDDLYLGSGSTGRTTVDGSNTVLASTINHDGTPIQIDVYVFINGDNAAITTQNAVAENLTAFTVGISFTCTGANA